MARDNGKMDDHPSRPVPDPTTLTTAALRREISSLTEYMLREVGALKLVIESSQAALKELVDTKVNAHNLLDDARFERIDVRFNTIEQHRIELKEDTTTRLNYVIEALKERADEHFKANQSLIEKSEQAADSSIAKLGDGFKTTTEAILQRIDDLKERVTKVESIKEGALEQRTEGRAITGSTVAIVGVVITAIIFVIGLLGYSVTRRSPTPVTPTPVVTITTPAPAPTP
jgi:hypothetical protein